MVIFVAGLASIDRELYEACQHRRRDLVAAAALRHAALAAPDHHDRAGPRHHPGPAGLHRDLGLDQRRPGRLLGVRGHLSLPAVQPEQRHRVRRRDRHRAARGHDGADVPDAAVAEAQGAYEDPYQSRRLAALRAGRVRVRLSAVDRRRDRVLPAAGQARRDDERPARVHRRQHLPGLAPRGGPRPAELADRRRRRADPAADRLLAGRLRAGPQALQGRRARDAGDPGHHDDARGGDRGPAVPGARQDPPALHRRHAGQLLRRADPAAGRLGAAGVRADRLHEAGPAGAGGGRADRRRRRLPHLLADRAAGVPAGPGHVRGVRVPDDLGPVPAAPAGVAELRRWTP